MTGKEIAALPWVLHRGTLHRMMLKGPGEYGKYAACGWRVVTGVTVTELIDEARAKYGSSAKPCPRCLAAPVADGPIPGRHL